MRIARPIGLVGFVLLALPVSGAEPPSYDTDIAPLFKRHCVKCHGPVQREGQLNLSQPGGLVRGGANGAAVIAHDAEGSLIWQRVSSDEMPPESPLSADEKELLKKWIVDGTKGLKSTDADTSEHWAFQVLTGSYKWADEAGERAVFPSALSPVDSLILQNLANEGLSFAAEADRHSQIRRVSFDLTGLPPTPQEIDEYLVDQRPDAFSRLVDRYLASPHYGERLGKVWLDAAGYADSNGYFNADTDRPLAHRYRDYVIRSFNEDKRFDQFIREQIAGDEIARMSVRPGETIAAGGAADAARMARTIELLEATHYLRNGQDGTGESDGNPDEVQVDRYTVIETTMQNVSTGLLGLTIQCAKCHDHKFEPLTQKDYYSFQAVLIPAFPPEQWMKPNERIVYASMPGELEEWERQLAAAEANVNQLQAEISAWMRDNRPRGTVLFSDDFEGAPESIGLRWKGISPNEEVAGVTPVNLNSKDVPGALIVDGHLQLREGGPGADKSLSTITTFDWSPETVGAAIQVTFDLVQNRVDASNPAERIGYLLALNQLHPQRTQRGGNLLIDGHPSGGTILHSDYPGVQSKSVGTIGKVHYAPGRNYGIRITRMEGDKFLVQHLVDGLEEDLTLKLSEEDLPKGAFGFEYCCGRSFVIDNVVVEEFAAGDGVERLTKYAKDLGARRKPLDDATKAKGTLANAKPGKIAVVTDVVDAPPKVHVFERGNYHNPGTPVEPRGFATLDDALEGENSSTGTSNGLELPRGSGRRLMFANWLTKAGTKRSSLMARVHVNRLWQHAFGTGIVATADNFGMSGPTPANRPLVDWLASEFIRSGGSTKSNLRQILDSSAYRQSSAVDASSDAKTGTGSQPTAWLSRFPVRRLDAEAIRDSLLVASGDFDDRMYGPYVPTTRTGNGETVVGEDNPGVRRRSIYLQQRRTQVHSLLQVFDAPSIVFNSTRRPRTTMPLQSLALLNSDFVVARATHLAQSLRDGSENERLRMQRAFVMTTGRHPTEADLTKMSDFLLSQGKEYGETSESHMKAWTDLCQVLLIGNAALYVD